MKLRFISILALGGALFCAPAFADDLREKAKALFQPIPQSAPPLPGETASPQKLQLGKMLFFDPRLSDNQDYSCASCHNPSLGGVGAQSPSSGHLGELGGRNILTMFNAVFNTSQYWDGRAEGLKAQVAASVMANPRALLKTRGGPMMVSPAETALTKQHAVERFKGIAGYADIFARAFPGEADPISYDNVSRAIASFEATLITPDAPFDRWLNGEDAALSQTQLEGLKLFVDTGCSGCHNGINFGGTSYARFGVVEAPGAEFLPPDDWGRAAVTKRSEDKYVFKVPGLRNVELTAPYFHAGQTYDLKQAVAVMASAQLGKKLAPEELDKIAAFLVSLTGRQPEIVLPILPPSGRQTKRPGD